MGIAPFDSEPDEMQDTGQMRAIERERKIKAAQAFLIQELADGPRWASEVLEAAKGRFTTTTLTDARERAHIRSQRIGNRWQWTTHPQRQELGIKLKNRRKRKNKNQTSLILAAKGRNHGAVTVS